jgi:hypothetical protein
VKEVRDAEIWPSSDGVRSVPGGGERSRFMEADCLKRVLKTEFYGLLEGLEEINKDSLFLYW